MKNFFVVIEVVLALASLVSGASVLVTKNEISADLPIRRTFLGRLELINETSEGILSLLTLTAGHVLAFDGLNEMKKTILDVPIDAHAVLVTDFRYSFESTLS